MIVAVGRYLRQTMPRLARLLIIAALLGACTPVQWEHARFGGAATADEVQECERAAYFEAQRQAFFSRGPWYPYYAGRRFYRDPWGPFGRQNSFFLERDLFDYCMRAKGFRLVPVRPADRFPPDP